MRKKIRIRLKDNDHRQLKEIVSKGETKARKITRCRILLLSDKQIPNNKIVQLLGITFFTVRQVQQRYLNKGLEAAIEERPRSGKPPKFSGKQQAQITAIACSEAPQGHSRWTVRLLADKVIELDIVDSISHMSVERILKKTNLSLI